jgi:anti-sigma factor RsiW
MLDHASDEMLSAYVDGELSGEESRSVERLLEHDAEARAKVRDLRQGTALIRDAFDEH